MYMAKRDFILHFLSAEKKNVKKKCHANFRRSLVLNSKSKETFENRSTNILRVSIP